jgi:hypothetical protein
MGELRVARHSGMRGTLSFVLAVGAHVRVRDKAVNTRVSSSGVALQSERISSAIVARP